MKEGKKKGGELTRGREGKSRSRRWRRAASGRQDMEMGCVRVVRVVCEWMGGCRGGGVGGKEWTKHGQGGQGVDGRCGPVVWAAAAAGAPSKEKKGKQHLPASRS